MSVPEWSSAFAFWANWVRRAAVLECPEIVAALRPTDCGSEMPRRAGAAALADRSGPGPGAEFTRW